MSPPSPRQIRFAVLGLIGLAVVILLAARAPTPKVGIASLGLDSDGIRPAPYAIFTITNLTHRTLHWAAVIDVPDDPNFERAQLQSSFRPGGMLAPSATDEFRALVSFKPGARFRLTVSSIERGPLLTRAWIAAAKPFPPLRKIWNPPAEKTRTLFSQWYLPSRGGLEVVR